MIENVIKTLTTKFFFYRKTLRDIIQFIKPNKCLSTLISAFSPHLLRVAHHGGSTVLVHNNLLLRLRLDVLVADWPVSLHVHVPAKIVAGLLGNPLLPLRLHPPPVLHGWLHVDGRALLRLAENGRALLRLDELVVLVAGDGALVVVAERLHQRRFLHKHDVGGRRLKGGGRLEVLLL